MLTSLSLIFLVGLAMGAICSKLKLPRIIGMLATGIILGPYVLDLLDPSILSISAELRKMALVIILLKAGLSLNLQDLKKGACASAPLPQQASAVPALRSMSPAFAAGHRRIRSDQDVCGQNRADRSILPRQCYTFAPIDAAETAAIRCGQIPHRKNPARHENHAKFPLRPAV